LAAFLAQAFAAGVSAAAQQQQSKLRGDIMGTGETNFTRFLSTTTTGTWAAGTVAVDLAYDEIPIPMTPIQELRAGLKEWLNI